METPANRVAVPSATASGILAAVEGYATQVQAVAGAEVSKLRHDPSEILTRAIQPAIWLVLFGEVMAQVRGITSDSTRYLDFLAPGILAQSVLFAAIFYGIAAIWERDLGVLHRYMVSPAPRSALVLGKALSAGIRGLTQSVVVYILAIVLGIGVDLNPLHLLGVAVIIALGSALFSTFSLIIACIVRTRERFMGIGQVLTMPIFFASNAIYPIDLMPGWLQAISRANPLTYQVDALRALMLTGGQSKFGLGVDCAVLVLATTVLVVIAARIYPRMTA
ncbi:ABC transporter permease [Kaistia dalseonensis]|uniref:Transport permease protein n=1 Tax=Kaistia dalseonensis TaxID=410840 RepID=A0ABU0H6J5_9HYPH|nr:ABC transporter permease [Kaistia dalseonensis]MCX5495345.1 ABC transporter permease [Kaistia dalseonensis]MDQ0437931.1 ABC-2 type transport system permease protein [Kaistia dalseonensis]